MGTRTSQRDRCTPGSREAGQPGSRAAGVRSGTIPISRIRAYADEIVRRFKPKKIILFGSYADGRPTVDSDVDLLVILPFDPRLGRKSLEIRQAVRAGFPVDLLVRSPEDVRQRLERGDTFLERVTRTGRILYEG